MKKLALMFALVFCSGVLFAQHIDIATQTGSQNISTVNQDFDGSGTFLPGNQAYVTQTGDVNWSSVNQLNNGYAGSGEYALVQQTGNYNLALIDQLNDGHVAYIYSIGSGNDAYTYQRGNKNYGYTSQLGNNNYAWIEAWGGSNSNQIFQTDHYNTAYSKIGSDWGLSVNNSHLYAVQDGWYNLSDQKIDGNGWAGGIHNLNNNGTLYQYGDYNIGYQYMSNGFGNVVGNTEYLITVGNSNSSYQWQKGSNNNSAHYQTGNYNLNTTYQNW
ncbi:MAG TPA: hypothetical protein VK212_05580 [Lentimicrobium sp.]|nr:hypothetical protein [Lentimicrobium sp.]